jgi:DNA-directed RNA polymerase specialized sigma24 family protein
MSVAHRHAAAHLRAHRGPATPPAGTAAAQLAALPPIPLPDALERLDAPSRELILLVYYRGYTAVQAASLLGLPAGAAEPRLRAALCALSRLPPPNRMAAG